MIVGSIHVQSSVNNRQQHCISHCHYSLHQVQITGIYVRRKKRKQCNRQKIIHTTHTFFSNYTYSCYLSMLWVQICLFIFQFSTYGMSKKEIDGNLPLLFRSLNKRIQETMFELFWDFIILQKILWSRQLNTMIQLPPIFSDLWQLQKFSWLKLRGKLFIVWMTLGSKKVTN